MFEISVVSDFSSAHNLKGYAGQCEELHGHNWKVEVSVASSTLDDIGMVVDFKVVKEALREVLGTLDHKYLNDLPVFKKVNPTSEQIAKHVFEELSSRFNHEKSRLSRVKVWETEGSFAVYSQA